MVLPPTGPTVTSLLHLSGERDTEGMAAHCRCALHLAWCFVTSLIGSREIFIHKVLSGNKVLLAAIKLVTHDIYSPFLVTRDIISNQAGHL